MEYADHILWLQEQNHIAECEDSESKECICLEIIEAKEADEADNIYHDLN